VAQIDCPIAAATTRDRAGAFFDVSVVPQSQIWPQKRNDRDFVTNPERRGVAGGKAGLCPQEQKFVMLRRPPARGACGPERVDRLAFAPRL
jgi:hypothetical protein